MAACCACGAGWATATNSACFVHVSKAIFKDVFEAILLGCSQWESTLCVPVSPCEWQAALTPIRFAQQGLIDIHSPGLECMDRPGHVESPDAISHIIGKLACFVGVRLQATDPMLQGERVMFAHALHIAHLEAAFLGHTQG